MAFKTAQGKGGVAGLTVAPFGLPEHWEVLDRKQCPRCCEALEYFPHAKRYTCYECGIKIPERVITDLEDCGLLRRQYIIGLKNFEDETPF